MLDADTFRPGFWECLVDGKWTPYDWQIAAGLEAALRRGYRSSKYSQRGFEYEVRYGAEHDARLLTAVQVNLETGTQRQARRFWSVAAKKGLEGEMQMISSKAWQHWHTASWTWPLMHESSSAAPTLLAPPHRVLTVSASLLSTVSGELGSGLGPYAARVRSGSLSCGVDSNSGRVLKFAVERLEASTCGPGTPNAPEWALVEKNWQRGSLQKSHHLLAALRIVNPALLVGFKGCFARMRASLHVDGAAQRTGFPEVKWLWHGTKDVRGVLTICNEGFDRALAAMCAFGKGCYFATNCSLANSYACSAHLCGVPERQFRILLLVAVLCGDAVQGSQNLYPPPLKPNSLDERFENAVDNVEKPSMWVTFKDSQAVPCYVVFASPRSTNE